MNVLATGVSNRVHYTETPVPTDWQGQTAARPVCRKAMVTGYVTTVEDARNPVNCPRCIAKTDTVQEEPMSNEREIEDRAAEVEAHNLAEAERARDENEGPGGMYAPVEVNESDPWGAARLLPEYTKTPGAVLGDLPSGGKTYSQAYAETARHFSRAEVGALLNPATERSTPPPPVTVAEAMAAVLHLARKLDVTTGTPLELEDLADLTERLAAVVQATANSRSAKVIAEQHQQLTTERGRAAAVASGQTARDAHEARLRAYERLAEGIVVYGQRR